MKKICIVLGSRANYSSIKSAMVAIKNHENLTLQLVVCASALLPKYGSVDKLICEDGFVINEASVDVEEYDLLQRDYPNQLLLPGEYLFVITNDIRYQDTEFSISIAGSSIDWRFINEPAEEQTSFGLVNEQVQTLIDFGSIVTA